MVRVIRMVVAMLVTTTFLFSAAPGGAALATGHPVDQEQTQEAANAVYGVGCPGLDLSPVAQTFVAGRTGLLDTISLRLRAGDPADTPDLHVQIRPATTGVVEAGVLAAATINPTDAQPDWEAGIGVRQVSVVFAQPAQVVAGERYAIVLVVPPGAALCPAGSSGEPSWWEQRVGHWGVAVGSSPSAYLNGEVIVGYDGITPDFFAPLNPDIWFQTFVTAGTETVAPMITALSPAAVPAGSTEFTLTLDGVGFSQSSVVRWNNAILSSVYVSSSRLTAMVTADLVASSGTGTLTVVTDLVSTPPRALFITDTEVGVSSVTTSTVVDGTAEASAGKTTGTATGSGTLTVAHYTSNPTTEAFPTGTTAPAYFDVNTSPDSTFSSVTVTVCQLSGTTLYWYDPTGAGWTAVSSQLYDSATGCITATLTLDTSPNTTQLGGTAFATATTADTLSAMTTRFVQDPKLHHPLQRQITAAAAAAERGDMQAKKGALRAYINLVSARSGKALAVADANELIRVARTL